MDKPIKTNIPSEIPIKTDISNDIPIRTNEPNLYFKIFILFFK